MNVTVDLSYDMSKTFGARRIDVADAATVKDAVDQVRARFAEQGKEFAPLSRVTAVAVNGVLISHRKGMRTRLSDGDTVAFVKATAGG